MSSGIRRERIWELDALRGFCILCVIFIHFMFDLVYFIGLPITFHPVYTFIQEYGGVIFVVLSGVCITLGSHSVKRGALVFGFGMVISLVTFGMARLGMAASDVIIWFGVLHLLGVCMLLYPLYKRLPTWALTILGVGMVVAGYCLSGVVVESRWLFMFGLQYPGFTSSDYFPLLPHLGWYMLGVCLGRTAYRSKTSLFPSFPKDFFLIRFFQFCGRQSLWIYLAHQPILYGVIELIVWLRK